MKGIETMPIRILLISVIMIIILGVVFYQFNFFLDFKTEKDFKENIVNVNQAVKTLQSTGDYGSFTTVRLSVPGCCGLEVSLDNNSMTGLFPSEDFVVDMPTNITAFRTGVSYYTNGTVLLDPGVYEIRLYYGDLTENQTRSYTMVFK